MPVDMQSSTVIYTATHTAHRKVFKGLSAVPYTGPWTLKTIYFLPLQLSVAKSHP